MGEKSQFFAGVDSGRGGVTESLLKDMRSVNLNEKLAQ